MSFIDELEGDGVQVELKYCERCGGLWLRPHSGIGIYCAACQASLKAMPNPGAPPPRKPRRRKPRLPALYLQARAGQADPIPTPFHSPQGLSAIEVSA